MRPAVVYALSVGNVLAIVLGCWFIGWQGCLGPDRRGTTTADEDMRCHTRLSNGKIDEIVCTPRKGP